MAITAAVLSVSAAQVEASNEIAKVNKRAPQVFGWIEEVMLEPGHLWKLDAKLDTGADTSSLHATGMRRVRAGGKSYVRFNVEDPDTGELVSLRRPYVRTIKVRQHNGRPQRRRVVLMNICLGDQERTIEVSLTDRSEFDYPMLLGRSALAGLAVVDPNVSRTREPSCWDQVASAEVEESTEKRKTAKTKKTKGKSTKDATADN